MLHHKKQSDCGDASSTHVHSDLLYAREDVERSHYDRRCHANCSKHTDDDIPHDDAMSLKAWAAALVEEADVASLHKDGIGVRHDQASVVEEMAWEVDHLHDRSRERVDNTLVCDSHMDCTVE